MLDSITTNAWAGYSFARKLRSTYAGDAFRVIRTSDSATQEIGFTGNVVDTNTLMTFAGVNSCEVTIVWDQSGNGRNLTNVSALARPLIVNAGVLQVDPDGKPAPIFEQANGDLLRGAGGPTLPTSFAVFYPLVAIVNNRVVTDFGGTAQGSFETRVSGGDKISIENGSALDGAAIAINTHYLGTYVFNGASSSVQINAGAATTGNAGATALSRPSIGESFCADMQFSEWLVWDILLSVGDTTTIKDNVNAFYTLY